MWKMPARHSATLATAAACPSVLQGGGVGEGEQKKNEKIKNEEGNMATKARAGGRGG